MLEYLSADGKSGSLCRHHIFLLAQVKDLTAYKSCNACPAEKRKQSHHNKQLRAVLYAHTVKHKADDKHKRERRYTVEHIDNSHYELIDPFSEISGKSAEKHSEKRFEYYDDKSYGKRNSSAVHKS